MCAALILTAFLTVVSPVVSSGDAVAPSSGDVVSQEGVQDPAEDLPEDQTSGSQDQSSDVSLLSDTLESIDEKLDVVVMALDQSVDAYQVNDYYKNYFAGVLQNMPYTDYLCYAQRFQQSGSYSYVTHYYLMYDLEIQDGQVVAGSYPCLDVYAVDNVYYMDQITKTFDGYPTMGYASFAPYSALIDRSFDFRSLYVGLICVMVFFIISRKTIFS